MIKNELFRFIAFNLEGKGQPEGDNPTIYGINKKWHPGLYDEMRQAVELDNPYVLQTAIEKIYQHLYDHSIARFFEGYYPLNINIFDMSFNKGDDDAILCWQWTVNTLARERIEDDGKWGRETKGSLYILKQFSVRELNEVYGYQRIKDYMTTSKGSWVGGLINRVIKLQEKFIKMREE